MKKINYVAALFLFVVLSGFQADGVKEIERGLEGITWMYENTQYIMSDERDAGSLTFRLQDHTFNFSNGSAGHDILSMQASQRGKWKVFSPDNLEYFIVMNRDTLGIEFRIDPSSFKQLLLLTQKSSVLHQSSYINTYYAK